MEQLDYHPALPLVRGLTMDDRVWDATVFTKNRQRRLDGDLAQVFFIRVVAQARERQLLSAEHVTVDDVHAGSRAVMA